MSAFIVDKRHIDAMVAFGLRHVHAYRGPMRWVTEDYETGHADWHQLDYTNADEVGAMLLAENVKSVAFRYQGSPAEDLPGRCDNEWMEPYKFRAYTPSVTTNDAAVAVLKAVACYEYQSCEHPEWKDERNEARSFCEALRHFAITRLDGYDDAAWEIKS